PLCRPTTELRPPRQPTSTITSPKPSPTRRATGSATTRSRSSWTSSARGTTLRTRPTTGPRSWRALFSPPAARTGRTRSAPTSPRAGRTLTRTTCSTSPRQNLRRRTTASLPPTA
ncbi:unnamed protein product, partial [Ectocarpus sp. 12 AP-2014]